jgi:hypothetical protein
MDQNPAYGRPIKMSTDLGMKSVLRKSKHMKAHQLSVMILVLLKPPSYSIKLGLFNCLIQYNIKIKSSTRLVSLILVNSTTN